MALLTTRYGSGSETIYDEFLLFFKNITARHQNLKGSNWSKPTHLDLAPLWPQA